MTAIGGAGASAGVAWRLAAGGEGWQPGVALAGEKQSAAKWLAICIKMKANVGSMARNKWRSNQCGNNEMTWRHVSETALERKWRNENNR